MPYPWLASHPTVGNRPQDDPSGELLPVVVLADRVLEVDEAEHLVALVGDRGGVVAQLLVLTARTTGMRSELAALRSRYLDLPRG